MFNWGITRKTILDSLPSLLAATLGIVAFVVLFVWVMLNLGTELLAFVSKFQFLQQIFEVTLGIRVDGEVSENMLFAVSFTHMIVFMLAWSVVIAVTTKVTVGEIERGTADLLLSMPVTRAQVFCSTTIVWVAAALLLSFAPLIGIWISIRVFETDEIVTLSRFVAPAVNFFCLSFAIGGLSTMAGTLFARRGFAISVVAAVLFISLVLNFAEPFVKSIEQLFYLGLLKYYRPVDVVRFQEWPVVSMCVLVAFGTACWLVGMVVYCRKDIPTA